MTATLKLPAKKARAWLHMDTATRAEEVTEWLRSQLQATKRKAERKRPARKARAQKKAKRAEAWAEIREWVLGRSCGACENHHCARLVQMHGEQLECDHMFGGSGRRRALESVETVWALCSGCHWAKTHNVPSPEHWLESFATHCEGYAEEADGNDDIEARDRYREAGEMARARLSSRALQGDGR